MIPNDRLYTRGSDSISPSQEPSIIGTRLSMTMGDLSANLEDLSHAIHNLYKIVDPLLIPDSPKDIRVSDSNKIAAEESVIIEAMIQFSQRIKFERDRILDINNRCQI